MNKHHPNRPWQQQAPPQPPGSVVFRMLCGVDVAGGIIGASGVIIKKLQDQTACKISLEESVPGCLERVVNITGDGAIDRSIKLTDYYGGESLEVEVSAAQMGLIRVFERVSRLQKGEDRCRLLAGVGQAAGVIGKGGSIVTEIQENSGARIRVLNQEQMPACAAPQEELIQIVGDVMAVKKALVAVSHCLQVCVPPERKGSHLPSQTEIRDRRATPLSVSGSSSADTTLSGDMESILRLDKGTVKKSVVFRLICSNVCAGGVIGKGASVVNKIQQETGAYIKFSSPAAGLKERVATISSLENHNSLHSSAQNAIVRVFARCVEIDFKGGSLIDLGEGVSVNAGILVTPDEINCLIDEMGRIASDISESLSVGIQLLETNSITTTSRSHKVVQIVGEYEKVKSALFQVTGKLRDKLFSSNATGEAGLRQQSNSTLTINSPHSTNPRRDNSEELPFANVQDHRPRLPHELFKKVRETRNQKSETKEVKAQQNMSSVGTEATILRTVEVFVPEKSFPYVYGENGDNLAKMREISGATVIVEDPSPGGSDGKVIISGTPECIFVAQSLLQAFIRE